MNRKLRCSRCGKINYASLCSAWRKGESRLQRCTRCRRITNHIILD